MLKVYEEEKLVKASRKRGILLEKLLQEKLGDHPNVGDIRGRGLFYSLEFVKDKQSKERFPERVPTAALVWEECMNRGVAVFTTSIGGVSSRRTRLKVDGVALTLMSSSSDNAGSSVYYFERRGSLHGGCSG